MKSEIPILYYSKMSYDLRPTLKNQHSIHRPRNLQNVFATYLMHEEPRNAFKMLYKMKKMYINLFYLSRRDYLVCHIINKYTYKV